MQPKQLIPTQTATMAPEKTTERMTFTAVVRPMRQPSIVPETIPAMPPPIRAMAGATPPFRESNAPAMQLPITGARSTAKNMSQFIFDRPAGDGGEVSTGGSGRLFIDLFVSFGADKARYQRRIIDIRRFTVRRSASAGRCADEVTLRACRGVVDSDERHLAFALRKKTLDWFTEFLEDVIQP